jgi:hypothetical protein
MGILTADVKRVVNEQRLGFVATFWIAERPAWVRIRRPRLT